MSSCLLSEHGLRKVITVIHNVKVVHSDIDEGALLAVGNHDVDESPAVLVEMANPIRLSKANLAQYISYLQEVHDAIPEPPAA